MSETELKKHAKEYLLEYLAKRDTPRWLSLLIQKVIDTNAKISDDGKREIYQELLKENSINENNIEKKENSVEDNVI